MARQLATIQRIKSITKHDNADTLEIAQVLGWQSIVKKDSFREGDLVIYCEIDSVLPDRPEFSFLKDKKFRIRTVRLRGQVSQGIIFPLSIILENPLFCIAELSPLFPFDSPENKAIAGKMGRGLLGTFLGKEVWQNDLKEGQEVTELLGVTLYTPLIPACLSGIVKGVFPSFMMKTDETRVQVLQDVLTRHKGTKCYITEKVDGSSCTYYLRNGEFGVCSRNLELIEDTKNAFWIFAREQKIEEKLRALNKNIAIQGELIGSGINGNSLVLREKKVLFFNVFDIDRFRYYDFSDFLYYIAKLGLETVPMLSVDYELNDNIEELVKLAVGKSIINPKVWREGIVIRPLIEQNDLQLAQGFGNGRLTFKCINQEYLIEVEQ